VTMLVAPGTGAGRPAMPGPAPAMPSLKAAR
jgi:hypothetical protein